MKHARTALGFAIGLAAMTLPAHAADTPEALAWEDVLERRLGAPEADTGLMRFDYAGLVASEADMAALDAYIAALAAAGEPNGDAQASAYWANLYNAITIDVVAGEYPVKSIRKIKDGLFSIGPWKRDVVTVEGQTLSLDAIEHEILRVRYPSPLVHYMVNCASVGCPNLRPALWRAETLDADRAEAARDFVNSPRGVWMDRDRVHVSSLYDWYEEDFGGSKAGVVAHLRAYADGDLRTRLEGRTTYDRSDYDWSLNGQ